MWSVNNLTEFFSCRFLGRLTVSHFLLIPVVFPNPIQTPNKIQFDKWIWFQWNKSMPEYQISFSSRKQNRGFQRSHSAKRDMKSILYHHFFHNKDKSFRFSSSLREWGSISTPVLPWFPLEVIHSSYTWFLNVPLNVWDFERKRKRTERTRILT